VWNVVECLAAGLVVLSLAGAGNSGSGSVARKVEDRDRASIHLRDQRLARAKWSVQGVNYILNQSATGRRALRLLSSSSLVVWKVKKYVLFKQRRPKPDATWPNTWEEERLLGRAQTSSGVRAVWILEDLNNLEAALTVAHEASHIMGTSEAEARAYEVQILIELPRHFLNVAPPRERGWVKQGARGLAVDERAIAGFLRQNLVYRDTDEANRRPGERLVKYKTDVRGNEVIDFGGRPRQVTGFRLAAAVNGGRA
jgi:hypothetical protein